MVKILVADENKDRAIKYCQCFANDERYRILYTTNGIDTINKYNEIEPHILILNSYFTDIDCNEILHRLSMLFIDRKVCNILVTTNNAQEKLALTYYSKVNKVVPSNINSKDLHDIIDEIFLDNKYVEIAVEDIQIFLIRIGLKLSSKGGKYLTKAIEECFYFPEKLNDFNFVLDFLTKKFNVDSESIRSSMRTTLKPINNNIKLYNKKPFWKLFDKSINITPRLFIEVAVIYLYKHKKNHKDSN